MKAIVTGAAQGIGAAITSWCVEQGGTVVGLDRKPIPASVPVAHRVEVDLTDTHAMQTAFAEAYQFLGGVDHLFLNAGIASGRPIGELDLAEYRTVMGINVDAMIIGTSLGLRMMQGGHIILTASLAGLTPLDLDPTYTASKHAVVGFVRAVGREASERGITVQGLCPGFTDTAILDVGIRPMLEAMQWPVMHLSDVVHGVELMLASPTPGACWVIQAGCDPAPFAFSRVPDPK